MKPDYEGKVVPCRKVPFKLLNDFKKELDTIVSKNILAKIDEPTEFVNTFAVVKKENNKLVIVLDPQYLNSLLLREHYNLSTLDEISSKISNATIFTKLDASKAFWRIQLSDES